MAEALTVDLSPAEEDALRRSCTRFLHWHGYRTPADYLTEIPTDTAPDLYGLGGVVEELEREIATLIGKPAAAFLPSGVMAQQIALRMHADRRGRRTVLFHPTCHVDQYELRAYERLHALVGRPLGELHRLITLADLQAVAELPAVLLLELPQREIGGQLPAWLDLVSQVEWARGRGAAMHLDGARLWGCDLFFGRSLPEICDLFDTVYVSFYKQLGALPGAALAGPRDLIAEAKEWRRRQGGTLYGLWPNAASGLAGLRRRLPRIPAYREQALAIADALRNVPGVKVVPDPPQAAMMHLLLNRDEGPLRAAAVRIAREAQIWTWLHPMATGVPGTQLVELEVGDATMQWTAGEFRGIVERLLSD